MQDYAEETEVARRHLKLIFAKTETRLQAELVRLLLTTLILPQTWF